MPHYVPTEGRARCQHRRCNRFVPAKAGRGPRKAFCNNGCRRRERQLRENDKRSRSPSARIGHGKFQAGHLFAGTAFTLIGYTERDKAGTNVLVRCGCGNEVVKALRNIVNGVQTNCADRSAHADPRIVHDPSYATVPRRLRETYGSATTLPCATYRPEYERHERRSLAKTD